jgi:hypothetical protein
LPEELTMRTSSKTGVFRKTNSWGLDNITENGKTTQQFLFHQTLNT